MTNVLRFLRPRRTKTSAAIVAAPESPRSVPPIRDAAAPTLSAASQAAMAVLTIGLCFAVLPARLTAAAFAPWVD